MFLNSNCCQLGTDTIDTHGNWWRRPSVKVDIVDKYNGQPYPLWMNKFMYMCIVNYSACVILKTKLTNTWHHPLKYFCYRCSYAIFPKQVQIPIT